MELSQEKGQTEGLRFVSSIPSALHAHPGCEQDVTLGIGSDGVPRLCGCYQRVSKAIRGGEGSGYSIPVGQLFGAIGELSFTARSSVLPVTDKTKLTHVKKKLIVS